MKMGNGIAQPDEDVAARFDDQHKLRSVFNFVFPSIDAARAGKNVNARSQPLFDKMPRETLRLLFGFTRGEDDDLVSHHMRISLRQGLLI